jgi:glycosyltransferase involved in cell wall biosynthesis
MPVLEGMASGLPVVASRCLGIQAFAHHDANALLADPQVPRQAPACDSRYVPRARNSF